MDDLDIITLAEAGELLGRSPTTLRHQAAIGRLRARQIGKTWVTTKAEVERYRKTSLGQPGRLRRRTNAETGWSVVYHLSDAIASDRGRTLSAAGAVAFAVDHATNEGEILVSLTRELPAQGFALALVQVDEPTKHIAIDIEDLLPTGAGR